LPPPWTMGSRKAAPARLPLPRVARAGPGS
jgi:hypothetical protein